MAKQFIANRSGQTPTLDEVPNEVIKIYDDKAAADLDLANIEENEIVATKAGESEGVVEVVDTVEENNPNPVSSGAVFDYSNAFSYTRGIYIDINIATTTGYRSPAFPTNIDYDENCVYFITHELIEDIRVIDSRENSISNGKLCLLCTSPKQFQIPANCVFYIMKIKL